MAVAGHSNVTGANLVRQRKADWRWTHQEAVLIDEERRLIVIVERAEIQRVASGQEIAPVQVGRIDLLATRPPAVQAAVGVLLQHVEVGQVVLKDVVVERAEQARAGLLIAKDEPAKIAGEALNADAQAGEIVVVL